MSNANATAKRRAVLTDRLPRRLERFLADPRARRRVARVVATLDGERAEFVRLCLGAGHERPIPWVLAATFLDLSREQAIAALEAALVEYEWHEKQAAA
jgi:hypothetical protein